MAEPDPIRHDKQVTPILSGLLDCVVAELEESALEVPAHRTVHNGQVSIDWTNGDECDGQLWVRFVDGYVSVTFPEESPRAILTGKLPMAWVAEVGLVRCMPQPDDTEPAPADEVIYAAATSGFDDMEAMRRAICKCLSADDTKRDFVLGHYTPYGPDTATGGSWMVVFKGL